MTASVSIVVPALDESRTIGHTLAPLQAQRRHGLEIIVVDGGSSDDTVVRATPLADLVLTSERGRARQMNVGAAHACGDVLLFLHADTRLPDTATAQITEGLSRSGKVWGRFDVQLSGAMPLLRLVEALMNIRSRWSGIATGDQAMFVTRDAFEQVGGFPDIPLMEDIALSHSLKSCGDPLCLRQKVITSSRRWEQHGVLRTVLHMWRLRLAYFLGVPPHRLVKSYYRT